MKSSLKTSIRLGVNVDHVATLRQVRGDTTPYPNLLDAVKRAVKGGADQITIHLREDRRHIQLEDLRLLSKKCPVDLNLEMAATEEMLQFALKYKPEFVCLVPEKRHELTTEGGLDVRGHEADIKTVVSQLARKKIGTSLFIDPDPDQVLASKNVGGFAVEFHTGTWVHGGAKTSGPQWARLKVACAYAHSLGLKVHAGHGLDYDSARKASKLPHMRELNIGHSIVCHALTHGMEGVVSKMKNSIKRGRR